MNYTRKEYRESLAAGAKNSFAGHRITQRSEGRWLLQRRYRDDTGWDNCFATEVICIWNKGLFVDGDIDHLLFRYGPPDQLSRVSWMASRPNAWNSYFVEKATIGTGRALIYTWDEEIAQADLRELREEVLAETQGDGLSQSGLGAAKRVLDAIDDIFSDCAWSEGFHEIQKRLYESGYFDDGVPDVGMIESPRLFFVHAALQRLDALLETEKQ